MRLTTLRDNRGVALVLSLMALIVVGGIGLLMFTRTINEVRHSRDDARIVQTLMVARGGANIGSVLMGSTIADELHDVVEATSKPGRWAYGLDFNPMVDQPEPTSVAAALEGIASQLQNAVNAEVCSNTINMGDGATVQLRIYFTDTACGEPLPASITLPQGRYVEGVPRGGSLEGIQTYALPVVMVSDATIGDFRRNIVVQGEYVFDVGQTSFAHYAYFTNRETTSSSRIWFTEETIIDGPTHTNANFSFYQTPWFGGRVTSAGCQNKECTGNRTPGAYFYNNSSYLRTPGNMSPNMNNPNHSGHRPLFDAGVQWNGAVIDLPTSAYDQAMVAQGINRLDSGLYFNNGLYSLDLWAGDAAGNILTRSGGTWSPPATWQYIEACTGNRERFVVREGHWTGSGWNRRWVPTEYGYRHNGECVTYRFNADSVIQRLAVDGDMANPGDWVTEPRAFNGVVYVNGDVARFRGPARTDANNGDTAAPALASFAQITLASTSDIRITEDLTYEQPPCTTRATRNGTNITRAVCENLGFQNVLGVYSQGGDIIVGNDHYVNYGSGNSWDPDLNAPTDVNVHAVLMSATDQVRVEGYVKEGGNGSFDRNQGSFNLLGGMIQENRGIFGTFGDSGRRGYDRVYTYDPRMLQGIAPPFFPTTGLGDVSFAAFFSFGQREQVY